MKYACMSVLVMALVTYAVRAIPMFLFSKEIKNKTLLTFLDYVPCVVLAAMTFPAIFSATSHSITGIVSAIVAVLLALKNKGLVFVASGAVVTVFVIEFVFTLIS